jgi:hypothetical protein
VRTRVLDALRFDAYNLRVSSEKDVKVSMLAVDAVGASGFVH